LKFCTWGAVLPSLHRFFWSHWQACPDHAHRLAAINWQQIQSWQQPILDREDLPNWFKMALFNELYDLTGGGTLGVQLISVIL